MMPLKGVSKHSDEQEISGALVRFRSKLLAHREATNARLELMETSLRTDMATFSADLRADFLTDFRDFRTSLMEELKSWVAGRNSTRRAPETAPPDGAVRFASSTLISEPEIEIVHSHLYKARCKQVVLKSTAVTGGVQKRRRSRPGNIGSLATCKHLKGKVSFQRLVAEIAQDVKADWRFQTVVPPLLQFGSNGNSSTHIYPRSNHGVNMPFVGLDSMNMCVDTSVGVRNEMLGVKKDKMHVGDVNGSGSMDFVQENVNVYVDPNVGVNKGELGVSKEKGRLRGFEGSSCVDFVQGTVTGGHYGSMQPLFGQTGAVGYPNPPFVPKPQSTRFGSVGRTATGIRDKGGGLPHRPVGHGSGANCDEEGDEYFDKSDEGIAVYLAACKEDEQSSFKGGGDAKASSGLNIPHHEDMIGFSCEMGAEPVTFANSAISTDVILDSNIVGVTPGGSKENTVGLVCMADKVNVGTKSMSVSRGSSEPVIHTTKVPVVSVQLIGSLHESVTARQDEMNSKYVQDDEYDPPDKKHSDGFNGKGNDVEVELSSEATGNGYRLSPVDELLKQKVAEKLVSIVDDMNLGVVGHLPCYAARVLSMTVEEVVWSRNESSGFQKVNSSVSSSNLGMIGLSKISPLVAPLSRTKVMGIPGGFSLLNGQLQPSTLQLLDVSGNRDKLIHYWTTPEKELVRSLHSEIEQQFMMKDGFCKEELDLVYQFCTSGNFDKVLVGMLEKWKSEDKAETAGGVTTKRLLLLLRAGLKLDYNIVACSIGTQSRSQLLLWFILFFEHGTCGTEIDPPPSCRQVLTEISQVVQSSVSQVFIAITFTPNCFPDAHTKVLCDWIKLHVMINSTLNNDARELLHDDISGIMGYVMSSLVDDMYGHSGIDLEETVMISKGLGNSGQISSVADSSFSVEIVGLFACDGDPGSADCVLIHANGSSATEVPQFGKIDFGQGFSSDDMHKSGFMLFELGTMKLGLNMEVVLKACDSVNKVMCATESEAFLDTERKIGHQCWICRRVFGLGHCQGVLKRGCKCSGLRMEDATLQSNGGQHLDCDLRTLKDTTESVEKVIGWFVTYSSMHCSEAEIEDGESVISAQVDSSNGDMLNSNNFLGCLLLGIKRIALLSMDIMVLLQGLSYVTSNLRTSLVKGGWIVMI